ncbi:MAG: hypothetical protein FJ271_20730 [Planctomycetes bacterium]|nr:hypothetical protein [Planctomycetota bacterium]
MADPAALRGALADFLGAERYRKFVQQFSSAGRLLFWQEQEWVRFVAAQPAFGVGRDDLALALRVCWLHGLELQPDTVEVIDGHVDNAVWYVRAKGAAFPCAASAPVYTEGALFPTRPAAVWFCPDCRKAEAAWRARHAELQGPLRPTMVPLHYLKVDAATGCRIGGACPVGLESEFTNAATQYFGTFPLLAFEETEFSLFHRFDPFGHDAARDLIVFNNQVLEPNELIWAVVHPASVRSQASPNMFEARALALGPESTDEACDDSGPCKRDE